MPAVGKWKGKDQVFLLENLRERSSTCWILFNSIHRIVFTILFNEIRWIPFSERAPNGPVNRKPSRDGDKHRRFDCILGSIINDVLPKFFNLNSFDDFRLARFASTQVTSTFSSTSKWYFVKFPFLWFASYAQKGGRISLEKIRWQMFGQKANETMSLLDHLALDFGNSQWDIHRTDLRPLAELVPPIVKDVSNVSEVF